MVDQKTENFNTSLKVAEASGLGGRKFSLAFLIGVSIVSLVVLMACVSLFWTPYDVINQLDVSARLQAPSAAHLMGTDYLGRDVLSQIMVGARTSMSVAVVAIIVGVGFGVPLGLFAAARGGRIDQIIMRGNDLVFAFPALVLAILLTALLGPGAFNAIVAIGVFNIPVFARLARGPALSLWSREFVLAARVAGKNKTLISIEHILPNISNTLIVNATIQFSLAIIAEAGLSYVGLGAQPPTPSWGRMLAESQTMISFAPWLAIFPGGAIFITVFGLNLFGDGLRDYIDPKLARQSL